MFWIIPAIVLLIVAYFTFVYCRAFLLHPLRHMPTAPMEDPFLGDTSVPVRKHGRHFDGQNELREKYGRIRRHFIAFGESRLVVTSVDEARQILATNAKSYCRGKFAGGDMLRVVFGDRSLIVTSGDVHQRLRRVAAPAFKQSVLRSFLPAIQACSRRLCERWSVECAKNEGRWSEIFIKDSLSDLTLDIVGIVAFGYDFGATDEKQSEYADVFRFQFQTDIPLLSVLPGYGKIAMGIRKIAPLIAPFVNLDAIKLLNWIDRFRATIPRLLDDTSQNGTTNNNAHLLRCMQESSADGKLDDGEIKDMVMTFILAGHETTSVAVSWTLLLLTENPDWQQRCRDEVKSLSEPISWDSLHKLKIVKACAFEAMRLFPPVPVLNRMTLIEDTVGGYRIPAGMDILVQVVDIHRDPDVWPNPDEFRPERFFDEEHVPQDAFLPFGNGVHKCIGYQLATVEILAILVSLLARFEFANPHGTKYREKVGVTMFPYPDLKLTVHELPDC